MDRLQRRSHGWRRRIYLLRRRLRWLLLWHRRRMLRWRLGMRRVLWRRLIRIGGIWRRLRWRRSGTVALWRHLRRAGRLIRRLRWRRRTCRIRLVHLWRRTLLRVMIVVADGWLLTVLVVLVVLVMLSGR